MAKVTYTGPGPADVYPYMHLVKGDGGNVVKSWGHRVFNNGVAEEVKEPENLATFLKMDRSVVKIDANKTEIAAAEALLK